MTDTLSSVCVVGAGAIGSLCAGHLGQTVDVSVLVRRDEHAAALNSSGLRVSGKSDLVTPVEATTDPTALPSDLDLIILATKATELEAAVRAIEGRFPGAIVMTIQNGLGAEEIVADHGNWMIVSSVTFMSGTRESDTEVRYELDTATWMGPYQPSGTKLATVQAVSGLFNRTGLAAEALPDVRPALWSKLIFNATINSVSVLTDLPHVARYTHRELDTDLGHLMYDLIEEGKTVAAAAGIELFEDPWEMNCAAVAAGSTHDDAYAHVPSMLADVRAGRRTEVDFILGSLVREAGQLEVPVPLCNMLYQLVKAHQRDWKPTTT